MLAGYGETAGVPREAVAGVPQMWRAVIAGAVTDQISEISSHCVMGARA